MSEEKRAKKPGVLRSLLKVAVRAGEGRPAVGSTPADVVHRENKWRLLRYRPLPRQGFEGPIEPRRGAPVLLIPSLINRHYVLDLLPGKSFAEFMVRQGHDVYIIDWGTPADEDRFLTFAHFADRYIGRALSVATRISGAKKAHVLGYCLGGTLSTIHAALYPERLASLTALATPINFIDDGSLSLWVRSEGFDVDALVDGAGVVPWPLMHLSFQLLKPTMSAWKAVNLIDRSWDDRFLDGFFAMETWGNDAVSFPGECARTYVRELYRENRLVAGTFAMNGKPVHLSAITCPTMAISFTHDHIVPWQSAGVLIDHVGAQKKEHVHLPGGHVGAVISSAAAKELWPKISEHWKSAELEM